MLDDGGVQHGITTTIPTITTTTIINTATTLTTIKNQHPTPYCYCIIIANDKLFAFENMCIIIIKYLE